MKCEKGVFALNTGTGNQTVSLVDSTLTPKFVMLWASYETAPGITDGDGIFSFGMGTRDGGATQQQFVSLFNDDAAATTATVREHNSDAILVGLTSDAVEATATDYEVTLVSFAAGQFVINVGNGPASSIKVHYLVIGGADVTAARVGEFQSGIAVATQDVTVNTGFGQPDLLLFAGCGTVNRFQQTDARFYLGFAKSNSERASAGLHIEDASNTVSLAALANNSRCFHFNGTGTGVDAEADLSAKASWPADGFQITWSNQASIAAFVGYAAFKLTDPALVTIGTADMPTSSGDQDLAVGSGVPTGALLFTTEIPLTLGTLNTTHADLGGICLGGTDGTREGFAGTVDDDANTDSRASRFHSETKALARHIADAAGGAATLDAECDSSIVGANVRLTWGDPAALATDFIYLLLADTPAAAPERNRLVRSQARHRAARW